MKTTRVSSIAPRNIELLEDRVLLAAYATTTNLSFNAPAAGINQTGFTASLPTSKGKGLVGANVTTGNGQLRLLSTAGDFWQTRNTQDNALNLPVNGAKDFQIESRLTSFPFTKNWQNAGIFVGTNEDNYVKLVGGFSGQTMVQLGTESAAVFSSPAFKAIKPGTFSSLDLRLTGTAATKTIAAQYRLNSSDNNAWVTVGSTVNAAVFNAASKAGVLSTNFGGAPVNTSFNWFTVAHNPATTPPITPPITPPAGSKNITIGVNLDGIAEFSPIAPFVDLAVMFRPWGSIATPYTTDPSIPLSADNYPLSDAGTITYATAYPDGDYQVSYQGQANLSFNGLNGNFQVTSSVGGITKGVLHLEPATHPGTLAMYATGLNAANPLRNLHIISPDMNPAISDTFRPVFLQKLAPFDGYMRMMDWMQTNSSPVTTWADRTSPTEFSYVNATGIPYEVIAKLANTAKKDVWINIPVKADNDYITRIARLFRDTLAADRKIYIEFGNELWAYWSNPDAMINLDRAKADPLTTKSDPWGQSAQGAARRIADISGIFKIEWGATKWNAQVRPVLGGLVAGSSWGDIALQFLDDKFGGAKNVVTGGMAIGDYVGVVNDFAAIDNETLTLDKLFAWGNNFIDTQLADWIKQNKAIADKHGVALHSYEGGQAFAAPNGMNESLKRAAQDDPRMGDLYKHLIRSWTKLTNGGIFGNFAMANRYSQYGYWGLLQGIDQPTSVKYEAIKQLVNESVA